MSICLITVHYIQNILLIVMMICIQIKMLTFMDGFYNMIERMYKPKKVNVEKLKQYLN